MDLMGLHPDVYSRAMKTMNQFYDTYGLKPRITQGLRTIEDQNALYEKGRSTPGKVVTYARGGDSFHNYGLAFDICFSGVDPYLEKLDDEKRRFFWSEYGRWGKEFGLEWGGDFLDEKQDLPHMQKSYGFTIKEISDIYAAHGMAALWSVINDKLKEI